MSRPQAAGGTPATVALTRAGVSFRLHHYSHDPQTTAFGDEAAVALGVDPHRIFKTLVAELAGSGGRTQLAVAVVPVALPLDLKAMAAACGVKKATMADPDVASRSSGYVVGGISPVGQRIRLRTVLDSSATSFETVFVSAGKRGLQVELAPQDLAEVTAAQVAPISAAGHAG